MPAVPPVPGPPVPGPGGRRSRDSRDQAPAGRVDLPTFERELADFQRRIVDLRQGTGDREQPATLGAAFVELELAHEELAVAREELAADRERLAVRDSPADRERKLLRGVFTDLPVAVFVLERDAVVRRANRTASALIGASVSYATGKPFPVFLDIASRGPFRSHFAAVTRAGRARACRVRLLRKGEQIDVLLRITVMNLPGEPDPPLVVVALPACGDAVAVPERVPVLAPAVVQAPAVDPLDLMSALTTVLLDGGSIGGADPDTVVVPLLRRVAALFAEHVADWVLIDLQATDGSARRRRRRIAAGPDADLAAQLESTHLGTDDLAARAAAARRPTLLAYLAIDELGVLADGRPVAAVLAATSALTVPVLPPPGTRPRLDGSGPGAGADPGGDPGGTTGPVLAVLTLLRGADRPVLDLATAGLMERLAEHLAQVLRRPG